MKLGFNRGRMEKLFTKFVILHFEAKSVVFEYFFFNFRSVFPIAK